MARCYLNSYIPLVANVVGRQAAERFALPPLIDGSIRREPDLEHDYPGISGLCRTDKFAPRLQIGDRVAYMTNKRDLGTAAPHHRLTAVLEVVEVRPTHEAAAAWYRNNGLPLPSNCMVPGNRPKPLEQSHRICSCEPKAVGDDLLQVWDEEYQERARQYPIFVVCRPLFCDLSWNAPIVKDEHFTRAFGQPPSTQNPGALDGSAFDTFLKLVDVHLVTPPGFPTG
jgi:hypothetical protein